VVAVAVDGLHAPRDRRGADPDVDAGVGPPTTHLVEVEFGAAGLWMVEVPPGQDVNPPDPRAGSEAIEVAPGRLGGHAWLGAHALRIVLAGG